jgi:hypothetical protein
MPLSAVLRRHWLAWLVLAGALGVLLWAALAPLGGRERDLLYEIPQGAWERRMAGDTSEPLPGTIRLTLGVKDVLLLRNLDSAPQMFGPVMIMPGQEYRAPFAEVARHEYPFTARVSGRITIVVDPHPTPGLARLQWRIGALSHAIRYYKVIRPA